MVDDRGETVAPSRAFHLRPDAPLDLVTEVYWHVAFGLKETSSDDLEAARCLDELNRAYAMVVHGGESSANGARPVPAVLRLAPTARQRSLLSPRRKQVAEDVPRVTPWELLCVDRDAPQDVIELAYGYWLDRLRNSESGAGQGVLERLEESYAALTSPTRGDAIGDGLDGAGTNGPPLIEELAGTHAGTTPEGPSHTVETESDSESAPKARARKRPGRLTVAVRSRARRSYRRFVAVAKRRLVDPFGEFERYAREGPPGKPGEREEAQVALDVGMRFANLAAPLAEAAASVAPAQPQVAPAPNLPPARTETDAPAALVAVSGPRADTVVPIRRATFTIGAYEGCDLVHRPNGLEDGVVTARIWERGGRYLLHVLTDGSTVFVNDEPTDWALLEPGDRIGIADEVFVFQQS